MDLDRAAQIAAKRTERVRNQLPLYSDQLEPITAEQIQAAANRHAEAFERCSQELQVRGDVFRAQVSRIVTAGELAELDSRRASLPSGPEYHADFWRRQWLQYQSTHEK